MKILQIYELGPLNQTEVFNGIDVAILELSRHLSKLGHEVTILTGAGEAGEEHRNIDGINIISVDFIGIMKRTWSPWGLDLLRQLAFPIATIKKNFSGFDIYHGHIYTSGLLANYLARKYKGKVVNTIHGSYHPFWNTIDNPLKANFYQTGERILAPLLARLSDVQIHTGGYFAEQVVSWGVPQSKIKVIHNGVDLDTFNLRVKPAGFDKKTLVIFTARRLVRKNGVEYLIKAMKRVLREEECVLLIAGDGPEKTKLEALAERIDVSGNVTFLGLINHEQIPGYMALADIAVIPSIIEASSLFMLEAMAMQKPVIATRTGAIPEVITSNTGILVEPMNEKEMAEKIKLLLKDEDMRTRIARNAYKYVTKNYSWEEVSRKTEMEYRRILGE